MDSPLSSEMQLKCPYCPRRFDGLDATRRHVAEAHPEHADGTPRFDGQSRR